MSDKKPIGRGRGRARLTDGPWGRTRKIEDSKDIRRPKQDGDANAPQQFEDKIIDSTNGCLETPKTDVDTSGNQLEEPDSTVNTHSSPDSNVVVSNLSPHAQEFVPRSAMSPAADNLVPHHNQPPANNIVDVVINESIQDQIAVIDETLSFCFDNISESPGNFDNIMSIISPTLLRYLSNPDLAEKVATDLYEVTVKVESFAYNGVRMLMHLMNASMGSGGRCLRDKVLRLAQQEMASAEQKLENYEPLQSVSPLLNFLSELYVQMEISDTGRFILLGRKAAELLILLLASAHISIKQRLTTTVNTVKLIGTFLDKDDAECLNNVLDALAFTMYKEKLNLDTSTVDTVENLIKLRNSNWGSCEGARGPQEQPSVEPYLNRPTTLEQEADMGVFYGPDQSVMSAEEQMFLEGSAVEQLNLEDVREPSPASMDGEMQDAYEEFLRSLPPPTEHYGHQ